MHGGESVPDCAGSLMRAQLRKTKRSLSRQPATRRVATAPCPYRRLLGCEAVVHHKCAVRLRPQKCYLFAGHNSAVRLLATNTRHTGSPLARRTTIKKRRCAIFRFCLCDLKMLPIVGMHTAETMQCVARRYLNGVDDLGGDRRGPMRAAHFEQAGRQPRGAAQHVAGLQQRGRPVSVARPRLGPPRARVQLAVLRPQPLLVLLPCAPWSINMARALLTAVSGAVEVGQPAMLYSRRRLGVASKQEVWHRCSAGTSRLVIVCPAACSRGGSDTACRVCFHRGYPDCIDWPAMVHDAADSDICQREPAWARVDVVFAA